MKNKQKLEADYKKYVELISEELEFPVPIRFNLNIPKNVEEGKTERTVLIIPDTQHGFFVDKTGNIDTFHDPYAIEISYEINRLCKPDQVVFLGDHCDFPDLSLKYICAPEFKGFLQKTINAVGEFLATHRSLAPYARFDYLDSNHAKRLSNAVISLIPALHNTKAVNQKSKYPILSEPFLLGFDDLNINYHGDYPNEILWLNRRIACIHGYIAKNKSGATAQALLNEPSSFITGHIHRQEILYKTEWVYEGPIVKASACPGTLSKLSGVPSNKPRHNWQQGLLIVHILNDYEFFLEPILIHNRSTIFRGNYIRIDK